MYIHIHVFKQKMKKIRFLYIHTVLCLHISTVLHNAVFIQYKLVVEKYFLYIHTGIHKAVYMYV